ncbi:MAG: glutamine amidotransferase, partial [Acidimicrobiales bacterium]
MARVLVAGESWQTLSLHIKGFDSFFTSEYKEGVGSFREALEHGGHSVDFQPNHVAAVSFPDTVEALSEYGVVFLSDIGSNTLLMPPVTFAFGESRPNRLVALRSWVADGG